jgi:hypothetical protein
MLAQPIDTSTSNMSNAVTSSGQGAATAHQSI